MLMNNHENINMQMNVIMPINIRMLMNNHELDSYPWFRWHCMILEGVKTYTITIILDFLAENKFLSLGSEPL